jgi:hypothetical protein
MLNVSHWLARSSAVKRPPFLCMAAIAVLALSCGTSSTTTGPKPAGSPSPTVGTLIVDITVTGDAPFAGHSTTAFVATHVPCGASTIQMQVAEGTVSVKLFQAAWRIRVSGADYTMFMRRGPYRGPGTYTWLAMPEDQISPSTKGATGGVSVYAGDALFDDATGRITNGANYLYAGGAQKVGQFTVAADEASGTIDADLWSKVAYDSGNIGAATSHVGGTWRCK